MMNKQHQINQQDLFRLVKKIRENQVYQVFSLKRILKPKQARKGFRPISMSQNFLGIVLESFGNLMKKYLRFFLGIFWEFFWNLLGIF